MAIGRLDAGNEKAGRFATKFFRGRVQIAAELAGDIIWSL
jgi:hypothetical protein